MTDEQLGRMHAERLGVEPHKWADSYAWYDDCRDMSILGDRCYIPKALHGALNWTFDFIEGWTSLKTEAEAYTALGRAVRECRTASGAEAEIAELRARLEAAERERDEARKVKEWFESFEAGPVAIRQTAKEHIDLRDQLATVTAERDGLRNRNHELANLFNLYADHWPGVTATFGANATAALTMPRNAPETRHDRRRTYTATRRDAKGHP